ncbi:AMP-binding protein [Streptomyces sp. NPDC052101]|uniref:AMP-binding protein n=1 Tax=Streptomyces sp. NPDC052101 TaxID=3155763 RepID=UPI00342A24A5
MSGTLASDILAGARLRPGAVALAAAPGEGTDVNYGELASLAESAARTLDATCEADRPLALVATKSPVSIALILACLSAARPLLLLSPDLGEATATELVRRAGAGALATVDGDRPLWTPLPAAPQTPTAVPRDTSLILTTSGSTGVPKLVPLTARALDAFTAWAGSFLGLDGDSRVLNYAPLTFDLCLLDIWATLRHGGRVLPVDPARAADPGYLARWVRDGRPHVVQGVPLLFRLLTEAGADVRGEDVRHVLLTGDHVPRPVRRQLPRLFPHARAHNVYGCTETNDSMLHTFGPAEGDDADVLPLGEPIPGTRVAVLDGEEEVTGPGSGELIVSTPFQTPGYLAEPAGSERFLQRDGRAWYRTGDLVERGADGRLRLVGRTDFQVKVRGVRVNVEEVERVLAGRPEVAEAAVVALPDPEAGVALHAFVRPSGEGVVTGLQLRTLCAARLNRVAIPSRFHLVADPLPVGPTGKVDRRRLQEHVT